MPKAQIIILKLSTAHDLILNNDEIKKIVSIYVPIVLYLSTYAVKSF